MARTAVVLFNLGAPDEPRSVRPFLTNLFSDPAIISTPALVRGFLASFIAARRTPAAIEIYRRLGGGSPLRANTQAQADALQDALGDGARVFIAMRYWHPMSDETAREVAAWRPDEVVLLPLYPQFSTTTTASSIAAWRVAAGHAGLTALTRSICCYPTMAGLIAAHTRLILEEMAEASVPYRLLFSAHGLPERIVARGDPYPWQVEQTAAAVVAQLESERGNTLDWQVCYQSRVGPLAWIGPATEDELGRAAAAGIGVVLVPIAFVSEHSETLVELDITYRELAMAAGIKSFHRVPALDVAAEFIGALAELVRRPAGRAVGSQHGDRLCPARFAGCAQTVA